MGDYRPSSSDRVADQVRRYEASDGADGGTLEGKPVVILTHTGATTGAVRKTPLIRITDGDAFVAVASAAGATRHPAWYRNVVAHPQVRVQDRALHLDVTAREVHGAEKQRLWAVAESFWPHFPEYRRLAGREIPIFASNRLLLDRMVDPGTEQTGTPWQRRHPTTPACRLASVCWPRPTTSSIARGCTASVSTG